MKKTLIRFLTVTAVIIGLSSAASAHHTSSFSKGFHNSSVYNFDKHHFSSHTSKHIISLEERKKREEIARKNRIKRSNFDVHRSNRSFHRGNRFHSNSKFSSSRTRGHF